MLLFTIILFYLLRGCLCKEIFISQSGASEDVETCGNSTSPCRTAAFALSKIQEDGDTVSIDGGPNVISPYVYTVEGVIKINNSLVLQKWDHQGDEIISPKPILQKENDRNNQKLIIYANITFVSIKFHSKFIVKPSCTRINIIDCLFESESSAPDTIDLTLHQFFDLHVWNSKVSIKLAEEKFGVYVRNSIVTLHPSISWLTMKRYQNYFSMYNSQISGVFRVDNYFFHIYVTNCTFESTDVRIGGSNVNLHNSTFKSGSLIISSKTNLTNCGFVNFPVEIKSGWLGYVLSAYIYSTTFVDKSPPKKEPALQLKVGNLKANIWLVRCSFRNNTSIDPTIVSSLSIQYGEKNNYHDNNNVKVHDCDFIESKNNGFVFDIYYKYTQFLNTSVTCKDGDFIENLYEHKSSGKYLQTFCQTCEKSMYFFAKKTFITHPSFTENQRNQRCLPCLHNAICEKGNIRLNGGYWGYVDKSNNDIKILSLIACPAYYCCPTKEHCLSYDTCGAHRTGRLCSKCQPGYSCDMSAKYQCTRNSKCHNAKITFVLYTFLAVIIIVLLLYLKEIILLVKTLTNSQGNEPIDDNNDDGVYAAEADLQLRERLIHESFVRGDLRPPSPYQVLYTNDINSENYRNVSSYMISGSLKILFFFYQAAALIRIQSVDKIEMMFPKFFDFIFTTTNIKLDLSYSELTICVLPNINVIQVKILKLALTFIVLALIAIFWVMHFVYKTVKSKKKAFPAARFGNTYTQIDDSVPSYCNPPFIVRVKCVYVQFLLIAYASIAMFSFNVVHCVNINGKSYLYMQASIKCYQLWQYGMIAFIALWVAPFALSLYIGVKLLYKCSINPTQFLLMLSFPPAVLGILVMHKFHMKRQQLRTDEAMLAKHLLLVVSEPFRESTAGDGSKLCWESLLILRRMLLIIAQVFIMSPIIKLYPIVLLLLGYILHHNTMKPFVEDNLNTIEGFSLGFLISLVFINMFWANTRECTIMKNSTYRIFGKIAMFYEMFILSLPFILFAFYVLYRLFRVMRNICERIYHMIMHYRKQD